MCAFVSPSPRPLARPVRRRPRIICNHSPPQPPSSPSLSRRSFLSLLPSTLLSPALSATISSPSTSSSTVFSVIPTTVSSVNLQPLGFNETISAISNCDAVFLGEHHNSLVDHVLQSQIIDALFAQNPRLCVGLEMVQHQYQSVLDQYVTGGISELDLYDRVEWDSKWVWPYEFYLPVFRLCRRRKIPLVALSIDTNILVNVRNEGIEALTPAQLRAYIGNPEVFSTITKETGFKTYVNQIVTASYAAHARMGLLANQPNFNLFYTSRILRDEAMATTIVRHLKRSNAGPMVCLVGAEHVKFEYGVSGRVYRQLVAARQSSIRAAEQPLLREPALKTVMLNPIPADAYDKRDASLKLEMPVENNVPIPISDYLWFSSAADAKPRRRDPKNWLLPPVERLITF